MATVDKNFKIKNGLIVGNSTNLVNYTSASPFDPFVGQLWISGSSLYAWSSASTWVLIGDGNTGGTPITSVSTVKHEVKAAEPILKGQAVYISSATGNNMLVSKASNVTESMSSKTLGLIDTTLATNDIGNVVTEGLLSGLNTNGATVGDPVWLGTSGSLIYGLVNKPIAPAHLVYLGVVTRVNTNNGEIFVHVQNGFELQELHNVLIQTASNNQILSYNSASSLWMNKDLQAAIKEVDGSGSEIDSDLLDGQQGTYYLNWTNTTNKPDPIIGVNLTGNTTGAASVTLTDLAGGQISITTNTSHSLTASSIAGSLVTGTVANATNAIHANTASSISGLLVQGPVASANFALLANSASSINWAGVTGTPTTILGYGITDGLRASDAASAYIRVTSSAAIVSGYIPVTASQTYLTRSDAQIFYIPISASSAIVSGYIPVSASQAYLTRTDAQIVYIPISASSSIVANYVPVSASSAIVSNYIPVSSSQAYLTRIDATNTYLPLSGSISWENISNKPDPIIAVNLSGNTTGAASATLTDLTNGQISITTNTAFASTASSINWAGVTGRPTTLSGYGITDAIPVSSSQSYLTRSDANIVYAPLASASLTGIPIAPTAASGTNTQQIATTAFVRTEVSNLIASAPATLDTLNELATALGNDPNFATSTASAIGQRLLASTASTLYMSIGSTANHATSASSINWAGVTAKPNLVNSVTGGSGITIGGTSSDPTVSLNAGASVSWGNISSKPSPIVGVELLGDVTGAASATLSQLANGQISINTTVAANAVALGTDTTGNYVAGVTGGNGISITGAAGEGWSPTIAINSSASVDWGNVSNKPDPVIGVSLSGNTTGAASVTLTDLTNGQISITTNTAHAGTASSIAGSLVTGIVNNANHANTASSINWAGVTNAPDPIIGVNLTGIITGAASATLTDLTNGQVSITTAMNIIIFPISSSPTYTFTLADAGELVEFNHSSSVVAVIPLNATAPFPLGTKIDILQTGAGQVTASYVSGVTLNSAGGRFKLTSQWSAATLIKRGTDSWVLIGDLS